MVNNNQKYADYLEPTSFIWKRPNGPPRVWRVVDGRRKMSNGEIPRFSIQEVPEELKEDVIDFVVKYFITEEVTCVDQNVSNDPVALREFRTLWMDILNQGVSIVALLENSDPSAKPLIAGVNFLSVMTREDEEIATDGKQGENFLSEKVKKVLYMQSEVNREADVLKTYGVDKYLSAFGLSTHPDFRGQGLGEEILKTRHDVGLAYQIPVTETFFTGPASQTVASRVGFELLLQKKYTEIYDHEGNVAFPGVKVEFMKIMGKRLY